jgi:hypothetical protein
MWLSKVAIFMNKQDSKNTFKDAAPFALGSCMRMLQMVKEKGLDEVMKGFNSITRSAIQNSQQHLFAV